MTLKSKLPKPNADSVEEFINAVRYLLVVDNGMPEIVADEVIQLDQGYLQRIFAEKGGTGGAAIEAAEELCIKPRSSTAWIKVDEGEVVLAVSVRCSKYIKQLVPTGLYGDSDKEVADALLRRGIEAVLPTIQRIDPIKGPR